jgi:hypothetical protein
MNETHFLENTIGVLKNYKALAEKSFQQLNADKDFHYLLDDETNSIAVIMKHITGNITSRFTDFLTTDGEKPNRNRDSEFIDVNQTLEQLMVEWERGWDLFFNTVGSLTENDVMKTVTIRGEKLTVMQALNRQTAHYSYHIGQIVLIAKHIKSKEWKSLSIPKNKSEEFLKGTYLDNIK